MHSGERYFDRYRLAFIGIVILSGLVYLPSLFGQAMCDDVSILAGSGIGGGKSLRDCFAHPFLFHYYRPLTSASYFLDLHFFGPNAIYMHQTNILLHAVATSLVIWLTQLLFHRRRTSLLAGFIFAVQPAQVGTVAWIGGRCDQLGAILVVLMTIGLVHFHRSKAGGGKWLLLALAAYFAMMLVKEQFALFGLLVPTAAFAFRPKEERYRSAALTATPFLGAAGIFAGMWAAHYPSPYTPDRFGVVEQLTRFSLTTVNYVALMLAPNPWSMHSFTVESLRNPLFVALGVVLLTSGAWGIRVLWKENRPIAWLALGIFVGFLPISNLVPLPSYILSPYRLGCVCPLVSILLAVGFFELLRRKSLIPALALGAGVLSGLVLTPWGATIWTSEAVAFKTFATYDPGELFIRFSYIETLNVQHRSAEALRESTRLLDQLIGQGRWSSYRDLAAVVSQDPQIEWKLRSSDGNSHDALRDVGMFLALRGHILHTMERDDEAILCFQEVTRLDAANPQAWAELGQIAQSRKDPRALTYFTQAVAHNAADYMSTFMLAKCYQQIGNGEKAYVLMIVVAKLHPPYGDPLLELAEMQIDRKEYQAASETLNQAEKTIVDTGRLSRLRLRIEKAQSIAQR